MAFKHTLKRGSTRPVLRYPLPGVDLTGATATFLMSARPGFPATVNAPAVIANGALEYHWQHGDTSAAVMHYGEFEVVFPGGTIETFPADDYIRIEIKQDIGDGGTVAPPAPITLTGALVEAGADVASGAGALAIALSGSLVEAGSDTAAGTGTVTTPTPGSISLSAALIEAGADTASGTASVGITASAALVETGSDMAAGTGTVAATTLTTLGYVLDGDSLTNPSSGSSSYSPMLATNTGLPVTNKAAAGKTLSDRNATFDSRGLAALYSANGTNTLVLLAGINDIQATTPPTLASMQADMTAYIGKAKAAGFRVLVGTVMPSMSATGARDTLRLDFNTWLRAEAGTLGAEVIDFANVAGLTDPINDYYFTDGLHPAPRGHARMAEAVRVATGVAAVADTTPDAFSFPVVARAARSSVSVSDHVEILGITKAAPINVSGGEYSINGGAFTSAAGQVMPRDLVRVRVTTPATENQTVSATLTVGGVSATFTATTLTVDPTTPAGMIYPMTAGQGDTLRDDTGRLSFVMARDVVWRTAPVGVSYVTGGLNRAVATVDDPTLLTRPLLMGVIFRLASISGTRQLLSSDETGARIFQFRVKDGKPALQVWTSGSNSSTIQAVDTPVAANAWYLATAFLGDTASSLRLNGIEIAQGTHAARVNPLGTRPYLVMGARGNPFSPGNFPEGILGDIIAAGITPDATAGMIPALEDKLRAIASAKGVTLP